MGEEDRLSKVLFFKDSTKIFDALEFFGLDDYSEKDTLIKLHMGELNNKFFVRPDFVKLAVNALYKKFSKPFLYDTTVLYNSKRKFVEGYKEVAQINGFTSDYLDCNVVIDDEGVPVKVENNIFYVGKTLFNIKNIIGISHFKGHIASGMGGTIKNFGMGGVIRESKKFMHHSCKPIFNKNNCQYCKLCSELCPFNAIKVENNNWEIDTDSCFGCGVCVENCEFDALNYVKNDLSFFLACSTKACVDNKKAIYVNDVNRISRSCDCDPDSGPIICPDVGFFVSDDPVAIDAASLDAINKIKPNVFENENKVDPYKQIRYGEQIGLGSSKYKLISI